MVKFDHALLTPETAKAICEPFGIEPNLGKHRDTRSQFKGLTLSGINPETGKEFVEGDYATGVEAHNLAVHIARHLQVEFTEMFGIGSQLRSACQAILKSLCDCTPLIAGTHHTSCPAVETVE